MSSNVNNREKIYKFCTEVEVNTKSVRIWNWLFLIISLISSVSFIVLIFIFYPEKQQETFVKLSISFYVFLIFAIGSYLFFTFLYFSNYGSFLFKIWRHLDNKSSQQKKWLYENRLIKSLNKQQLFKKNYFDDIPNKIKKIQEERKKDIDFFYLKYLKYISLITKFQTCANIAAIVSIISFLIAFLILNVIYTIPDLNFDKHFWILLIYSTVLIFFIIIYYSFLKFKITKMQSSSKKRINKKIIWNYPTIFSFLVSHLKEEIKYKKIYDLEHNEDIDKKIDSYFITKFPIEIRNNFFYLKKDSKWSINVWIPTLVVLLWSIFIVFIPTLALWWHNVIFPKSNYTNPSKTEYYSFIFIIIFLILSFIFTSICIFRFFVYNNFQLNKEDNENDSLNIIKANSKIKTLNLIPNITEDEYENIINKYKKNHYLDSLSSKPSDFISRNILLDDILRKEKLFLILGILKNIFKTFDFNLRDLNKKEFNYEISLKDKFGKDKKPLKNLYLMCTFNENSGDFNVKFSFLHKFF